MGRLLHGGKPVGAIMSWLPTSGGGPVCDAKMAKSGKSWTQACSSLSKGARKRTKKKNIFQNFHWTIHARSKNCNMPTVIRDFLSKVSILTARKQTQKHFCVKNHWQKQPNLFFQNPAPLLSRSEEVIHSRKKITGQQLSSRPMVATSIRGSRGFKNQNVSMLFWVIMVGTQKFQ